MPPCHIFGCCAGKVYCGLLDGNPVYRHFVDGKDDTGVLFSGIIAGRPIAIGEGGKFGRLLGIVKAVDGSSSEVSKDTLDCEHVPGRWFVGTLPDNCSACYDCSPDFRSHEIWNLHFDYDFFRMQQLGYQKP
jgi:hypothetical protein